MRIRGTWYYLGHNHKTGRCGLRVYAVSGKLTLLYNVVGTGIPFVAVTAVMLNTEIVL